MLVLIRADASSTIGTGHVMRCLSLAELYKSLGADVRFICKDFTGNLITKLETLGYPVERLSISKTSSAQTGYSHWLGGTQEDDLKQTRQFIHSLSHKPDLLIVDHYSLNKDWETPISAHVEKIMVIDDLANRHHNCDILVDQSPMRGEADYQNLVKPKCQLLLGNYFSILNPSYLGYRQRASFKRQAYSSLKRLLLNFGGSDQDNLTLKSLQLLENSQLADVVILDVVVGAAYQQLDSLQLAAQLSRFQIEVNQAVKDMPQRQLAADLAIGAAGGSAWERCYLGLPTICYCMVENQRDNTAAMDAHAVAVVIPELTQQELDQALVKVDERYQNLSAAAQALIDGHGTERIAFASLTTSNNLGRAIYLQRAARGDAEQLFQWQSLPQTRQYANSPEAPLWQEHLSWFEQALDSSDEYIFLAKSGNVDLGSVRLTQQANKSMLISIYCAPAHYRQGNAYAMLRLIRMCFPTVKLEAQVKIENHASQKLFKKSGFQQIKPDYWVQEQR
ncbi:UDP-2,4-diacetamido-2,4,6-trideoxy-beta-L-altropyranose hydrolase [Agarivorans sp. Alg241-V36]|uniref:UDP-2,4-diacetamido-2,4, 6-trideoxy-beta-L-altropyranose hydrolase n=1 Tax=Agarivorans sp. Alg241-V36 TaxID=2305992 RepID=UPI0013D37FC9|nr:UDP-2,4-diacetamido-2,4,6-trideoxy-beta-L-altropyranose hydrolase [Agarivorans sp. Alg241-V36]